MTAEIHLGKRSFTIADQVTFGALSGDTNPIHLDPIEARRSLFGEVVVHGLHLVLWALDTICWNRSGHFRLDAIKVTFHRPVFLDETVECLREAGRDGWERVRLEVRDSRTTQISFLFGAGEPAHAEWQHRLAGDDPEICDLTFEEAATDQGAITLFLDRDRLASLFPALAARSEPLQMAGLLSTTRLVGMKCPGQNSLLVHLDATFPASPSDEPGDELRYVVEAADDSLQLLRIAAATPGMSSVLTTIYRPSPVQQPSLSAVEGVLPEALYENTRCLVVGASRGLGEVTAKLVASARGSVRLTYCRGKKDAERVAADIRSAGHDAGILPLDVTGLPDAEVLVQCLGSGWNPSHLFYFATPRVFPTPHGGFDEHLRRRYSTYFVGGFRHTVELVKRVAGDGLTVFYPSTGMLNMPDRTFEEYCVAKDEGERLCDELERTSGKLRMVSTRLPALRTDLTLSINATDVGDPVPIMGDVLKKIAAIS